MLSPYIYLTFSALLKCVSSLEKESSIVKTQVNVLSEKEERKIIYDFLSAIKSDSANENDLFIEQVRKSKIWKGL